MTELNWRWILAATAAVGAVAAVGYTAGALISPTKPKRKVKKAAQEKQVESHVETVMATKVDQSEMRSSNSTIVNDDNEVVMEKIETIQVTLEILDAVKVDIEDTLEMQSQDKPKVETQQMQSQDKPKVETQQMQSQYKTQGEIQVETQEKLPQDKTQEKPEPNQECLETQTQGESQDMKQQDKVKQSTEHKEKGNEFFKNKQYKEAIQEYSRAIEIYPTAVYYGNRAACYNNLGELDQVVHDCTSAIEIDQKYVKAFSRRAQAFEKMNRKVDAVNDLTVICILQGFSDSSMAAADRLLKEIAMEKVPETYKSRQNYMPSTSFMDTFMESFQRTRKEMGDLMNMQTCNEAEEQLVTVIKMIVEREYEAALALLKTIVDLDMSDTHKMLAWNLYATFQYMMADIDGCASSLERALEIIPSDVDSLVKKATVFMEKGDIQSTIACYEKAEKHNRTHPDICYHRGQLKFLTGDFAGAVSDYKETLEIEPDFIYAHIQLGVAQYKAGLIGDCVKTFNRAGRKFPGRSEVHVYHGEVLTDQGKFEDAMQLFTRAIEMNPQSPLSYINKGILTAQWKQDFAGAEELIKKALQVDIASDPAYMHLGQVLLAQNKIAEAIQIYEQAVKYARTEMEMLNLIVCQEAAKAQKHVAQTYPVLIASFMK